MSQPLAFTLQISRNGVPVRSFTYDAAGNTLSDTLSGTATTYGYNDAHRMSSVTTAGALRGEYIYNARGQLVIRSVTNSTANGVTVYFYDQDGHVIAEFDGTTGDLKREYVWLGDMPVAIIDPGTPADTYYMTTDHIGRPIILTDASKSVVADVIWSPFGGVINYSGSVDLDLRFPGQLFQGESGLHYNWFRQYDPTTARYTQPDPLGLVDGPSRYAYVGNDPLQRIDFQGRAVTINMPRPGVTISSTRSEMTAPMCVGAAMVPFPEAITKNNCIRYCSDVALPTGDYGMAFARCMNQCMAGQPFKDWLR
ncbi:RHS repeat domain-containing protein [uncultured Devosia sp.]|uniref:RHS repeat domain-containing protein n=1 Tax=uncultured Devosia sp. TaxID=211434 RepID=UPI0035CA51A2